MLLFFRRPLSPMETARFFLEGLEEGGSYLFACEDTGETRILSGAELRRDGFAIEMPEPRSSRLWFYRRR